MSVEKNTPSVGEGVRLAVRGAVNRDPDVFLGAIIGTGKAYTTTHLLQAEIPFLAESLRLRSKMWKPVLPKKTLEELATTIVDESSQWLWRNDKEQVPYTIALTMLQGATIPPRGNMDSVNQFIYMIMASIENAKTEDVAKNTMGLILMVFPLCIARTLFPTGVWNDQVWSEAWGRVEDHWMAI